MGGVFKAVGKVGKGIVKGVGAAVNFIPNQLGKIPGVGKFLKIASGFALGGLIPGLGWAGLLGKMGGLGARLGGLAGKLPGAGKALGLASKAKDWGAGVFGGAKHQLARLPRWFQPVAKNQIKSLPQRMQAQHQQRVAGQQAATAARYVAQQQACLAGPPLGYAGQYFA